MRKSLLLLIFFFTLWNVVDAKWILGTQKGASDIKVGDTIVLEFIDLSHYVEGRFLAGSAETPAGVISDENIYVVEEGPLDIRTGAPTVYLKHVVENGYLKYNGGWQTISYDPDPANAANMQILSCGADIPWSNTYSFDEYETKRDEDGKPLFRDDAEYTEKEVASWLNHGGVKKASDLSVGFCYSTGENLYKDYTYLGSWDSADNIWFWQYTDTNQWNVYGVKYISDPKEDLQVLIDLYLVEGEYVAGTDPGYYNEDVVNAYNEAMQEALTVSITGTTDEEFSTAITNLKTAHAAIQGKQIPITEGYYYFVIANDGYLNEQGIEKAARVNVEAGKLGYKTFDPEDAEFVFEVTKADDEDEWWVQSLITGKYVGQPSNWYGVSIPVTDGKEEPQNIRYYNQGSCTGKWFWGSHKQHSTSYTAVTGTSLTTNEEGNLVNWGLWNDGGTVEVQYNCWYLRKITDEATIEGFEAQKAQAQRTAALNDLVGKASELYGKLFVYLAPDESTKLITVANGGIYENPTEDNQITFSTIRTQGVSFADKYSYLIDGDDTTYMQGSGYIQVILNEPQQVVTFEYNTRDASSHGTNPNWHNWGANERPNKVIISVTNDIAGGGTWTEVGTLEMGSLELPARATINLGAEYKFVRFNVVDNATGGGYFSISVFQMYEAKANETTSQYFYVAGLKDKADAMNAMLPEMRGIVAANTATDEDITKLWAAITAVNELYADTNDPTNLIKATSITIDKDSLTFNTIVSQTLVATISPDKALAIVKWSSCDENIATVDATGKVTPVTNGQTMIISKTIDGTNISDTCFVTVDFKATGIVIDKPSLTFNNMEPQTISATIAPAKASQSVTWISSDDNIATVDENGVVTPINNGKAIIFATTTDGTNLKDICMVTVDFKAGNISLDKSEITLNYAIPQSLTATITPDKANQSVVWSSSNPEIATVDELGNVTPVANGQAMISATTTDGTNLSSSCTVTVDFKATSMFIDKESIVLNYADAQSLMAAVIPTSAQQTVAWSSSDETIVTVNENGELTPVGNGTAFVIATTTDGTELRDSCLVTVDLKATGVTIDKDSLTFNSFEPQTVVATISPAGAQDGVVWSSSDADIAIVDASGKVTPVNNGEAIIIATTTDGTELKDSCVVSVQIESQFESIATQTTISINALKDMSDIRVTIGEDSYVSEDGSVKIEGLAPASTYRVNISAELDGGTWHEAFDVTTADITTEFECKASPTTLNITGRYDAGDATVTNASFSSEEQLDEIAATGLEPGQTYTYTYYVTTEEGGTRSYEATFTTEALKLNTSQVKVVTVGDVVVSAESNITEEDNVKVGFEWRRTDWPDEIASKSGAAFIYNGAIEGYIRSLNTDKFWKIRTYFESGAGIKHYGDWITIDPSDASYFEPTVHTYAQAEVEGNTAYVKGYALNGSDKVTEQGFKYWEVLPSDLQPKYPQAVQVPAYAKSIAASGQLMTANISNLMYEMDYHYVAYVTTADGKTYYGEEQRIRIDDPVGIKDAVEESIAEGDVRTYTIDGRLVYAGAEKDMRLTAGLYIIRFADGTTKKVVIR